MQPIPDSRAITSNLELASGHTHLSTVSLTAFATLEIYSGQSPDQDDSRSNRACDRGISATSDYPVPWKWDVIRLRISNGARGDRIPREARFCHPVRRV